MKRYLKKLFIKWRYPRVRFGRDFYLATDDYGAVLFGEGCVFAGGGEILAIAKSCASNDGLVLSVGARTYIGWNPNIRAVGGFIDIGCDCQIAQNVSIVGANHVVCRDAEARKMLATDRKNVVIGDAVWIGVGVVVLPGVRIGHGAVIGANSLVNCDVPAFEVWGGCPARRLRCIA